MLLSWVLAVIRPGFGFYVVTHSYSDHPFIGGNSAWFWILCSYTLLLRSPVCMCFWFKLRHIHVMHMCVSDGTSSSSFTLFFLSSPPILPFLSSLSSQFLLFLPLLLHLFFLLLSSPAKTQEGHPGGSPPSRHSIPSCLQPLPSCWLCGCRKNPLYSQVRPGGVYRLEDVTLVNTMLRHATLCNTLISTDSSSYLF